MKLEIGIELFSFGLLFKYSYVPTIFTTSRKKDPRPKWITYRHVSDNRILFYRGRNFNFRALCLGSWKTPQCPQKNCVCVYVCVYVCALEVAISIRLPPNLVHRQLMLRVRLSLKMCYVGFIRIPRGHHQKKTFL